MSESSLQREIHVWFVQPEQIRDPAALERYRTLLSDEECKRCARFHFEKDRHHYLIAHALLRTTLSRYAALDPAAWTFSQGPHGRPEISNPGQPPLRFNLTHTAGLVGCVVTLDDDCGIDAEASDRDCDLSGIARRMFSTRECDALQALPDTEKPDYFFARWTLREAYVKALGTGIGFPTHTLTFTVEGDENIGIEIEDESDQAVGQWQFRLIRPTAGHIAAVAVRHDGPLPKIVVVREAAF